MGLGLLGLIGLGLNFSKQARTCACGGLFSVEGAIDQNAERIIFMVNGDGTLTTIVGINYVGEAEEFSWILPVPSPPELDVAETTSLNLLDVRTQVGIREPDFDCGMRMPNFYAGRGGSGGGPSVTEGEVGPYEYAIIGSDDPHEMVNWLKDNDYRITDDMEPLIDVYVQAGMYFLAMRLQQDATVDDIQPIRMTYEADQPMVPIRLAAVAAVEDMPVIIWIFGDTQYIPQNYTFRTIDFATFQNTRNVRVTGYYPEFYDYDPNEEYRQRRDALQDEYAGQVFITEYAQPSANLLINPVGNEGWHYGFNLTDAEYTAINEDALLNELVANYPYVTRLYAQLSPAQMTVDPIFMPTSTATDVDNLVDLAAYVDPLAYYGCSTRTAFDRDTYGDDLPAGRTRLADKHFTVAHPEDWVLSEFTVPFEGVDVFDEGLPAYQYAYFEGVPVNAPDEVPVWILAPETLDETILTAYFAGEATPPMFVFSPMYGWIDRDTFAAVHEGLGPEAFLLARLGQDFAQDLPGAEDYEVAHVRYASTYDATNYGGLIFGMLASASDWETNGTMYAAMLNFAQSYQYYASDEWPNTLFLPVYYEGYGMRLALVYPEGWIEQMSAVSEITLTPTPYNHTAERETMPYVRLIPMQHFEDEAEAAGYDFALEINLYFAMDWMMKTYDFTSPYEWEIILEYPPNLAEDYPEESDVCFMLEHFQFDFDANGRRGQAALTQGFVLEWSVPEDWTGDTVEIESIFAQALQDITETTRYGLKCNNIPYEETIDGYVVK